MMEKVLSKYAGQYVASIDGKIIAFGKNTLDAYNKAKKISGGKLITLEYIPTKKETITFL